MKKLTKSQLIGQRGELLAAERTMAMGYAFQATNRLETGVDGLLELRDQQTGQMLGKWVACQIKTREAEAYTREDSTSFEYLLNPDDLPSLIHEDLDHAAIVDQIAPPNAKRKYGRVVLVPSFAKAKAWEKKGAVIAIADNIGDAIEALKKGE